MSAQVKTRTRDLIDNPLGADGLEFVEFTSPDPERLGRLHAEVAPLALPMRPP